MQGNGNKRKQATVGRLVGKAYEPDTKPKLKTARGTWKDAREAKGSGDIFGEGGEVVITDDEGQLHYINQIDHEAEAEANRVKQGFVRPQDNARKTGEDAHQQQADHERENLVLEREDEKLAAEEEPIKDRRGLKPLGYVLVLAFLFVVAFPFDRAAAIGLPFSNGLQLLIAVTLGGLMLVAAHWAADKREDYDAARENEHNDPERCRTERGWYIGILAGSALTIVAMGAWRYATFKAEAALSGGLFSGGTVADIVFTLLALIAFVAAFFAATKYLWLTPLRVVRKKRKANLAARQGHQEIIDTCERVQAQAELTLDYLDQLETQYMAEIESWRKRRRDAFMHRARSQEHKTRRKLGHDGDDDPGPGARQSTPGPGPKPRDGAVRLRPLDTNDLADQVQARARAEGLG